ncbi:hypothetical protein NUW58_g8360 [Xylaria curta]|uniref:Uncharacterized protein n=1 Tax=Xylaria curta TaxID=42375 RepID=A0ACC1N9E8_9PEZI|nr:hypothetical protein NUW58_g8360 [Xylaria curta]
MFHSSFSSVIGHAPAYSLLISADSSRNPFFHKGCAYIPSTDELYITSDLLQSTSSSRLPVILISKLAIRRGPDTDPLGITGPSFAPIASIEWMKLRPPPNMPMPSGAIPYKQGVLYCSQGNPDPNSGGLFYMPLGKRPVPLVTNYFGKAFNSPQSVVEDKDGGLFFTDSSAGLEQEIRPAPQLPNHVYWFHPTTGELRVVADGLTRPSGITLSPNEDTLYITDTEAARIGNSTASTSSATIYAYDVVRRSGASPFLVNKRVFAFAFSGVPAAVTCDPIGNVYATCADGVEVWNSGGTALGLIQIPELFLFIFPILYEAVWDKTGYSNSKFRHWLFFIMSTFSCWAVYSLTSDWPHVTKMLALEFSFFVWYVGGMRMLDRKKYDNAKYYKRQLLRAACVSALEWYHHFTVEWYFIMRLITLSIMCFCALCVVDDRERGNARWRIVQVTSLAHPEHPDQFAVWVGDDLWLFGTMTILHLLRPSQAHWPWEAVLFFTLVSIAAVFWLRRVSQEALGDMYKVLPAEDYHEDDAADAGGAADAADDDDPYTSYYHMPGRPWRLDPNYTTTKEIQTKSQFFHNLVAPYLYSLGFLTTHQMESVTDCLFDTLTEADAVFYMGNRLQFISRMEQLIASQCYDDPNWDAAPEKQIYDLVLAADSSTLQRCLFAPAGLRLNVGARFEKEVDNIDMSPLSSGMQGSSPLKGASVRIDISSCFYQSVDSFKTTIQCRSLQSRKPLVSRWLRVYVRPPF